MRMRNTVNCESKWSGRWRTGTRTSTTTNGDASTAQAHARNRHPHIRDTRAPTSGRRFLVNILGHSGYIPFIRRSKFEMVARLPRLGLFLASRSLVTRGAVFNFLKETEHLAQESFFSSFDSPSFGADFPSFFHASIQPCASFALADDCTPRSMRRSTPAPQPRSPWRRLPGRWSGAQRTQSWSSPPSSRRRSNLAPQRRSLPPPPPRQSWTPSSCRSNPARRRRWPLRRRPRPLWRTLRAWEPPWAWSWAQR